MMEIVSVVVSAISLLVSIIALRMVSHKSLRAEAADRALERFNRINEKLLDKPHLNDVFRKPLEEVKKNRESRVFIWYLFNQLEGTFLDNDLGILEKEYFKSYDNWLGDVLGREGALRDFLTDDSDNRLAEIRRYFSDSYWAYLQQKVQRPPGSPPRSLPPPSHPGIPTGEASPSRRAPASPPDPISRYRPGLL